MKKKLITIILSINSLTLFAMPKKTSHHKPSHTIPRETITPFMVEEALTKNNGEIALQDAPVNGLRLTVEKNSFSSAATPSQNRSRSLIEFARPGETIAIPPLSFAIMHEIEDYGVFYKIIFLSKEEINDTQKKEMRLKEEDLNFEKEVAILADAIENVLNLQQENNGK